MNRTSFPNDLPSLADCLRESFTRHASLVALEGRSQQLTFAALDARSAALAGRLAAAGIKAGDIVPLLMQRSPALVVAQVALIRVGAAYAPIDLGSPMLRQRAMLQQIHAAVVLADTSVLIPTELDCRVIRIHPDVVAEAVERPADDVGNVSQFAGTGAVRGAEQSWSVQPPDAPAYVMFTSGTTGTPKGVVIPQSGIVRLAWQPVFVSVSPGSRWAFLSSPAFDASTLEIWAPLLNGGCCVVQEHVLPTIDQLAEFLHTQNIDSAWLTSALFNAVVDDRIDALSGLQHLLTGGERISPQHARRTLDAYPALELVNGYGPTENTTFTLTHHITVADTENRNGIPIGTPIRGTKVHISSEQKSEHESEHEHVEEGELLAGGLGLALGYLHDAELTARKFVHLDGERWYRTGDLVRRNHTGQFEYLGRVDRQIKLQGHRIELDEVERTMQSYPGIGTAAVRVRGEAAEGRSLVGYYHCAGSLQPQPEAVLQWLRERLAPAAVPGVLYQIPSVPINRSGKIDYRALDAYEPSQAAVHELLQPAASPLSEMERALADIWRQILPTSREFTAASNFLEAGGNSLLSLQVSAQVRRQFGRNLSPIDVLRTPLLGLQAQLIESAPPAPLPTTASDSSSTLMLLTQVQQAILASSQVDDSGSAFLVQVALHFDGQPAIESLKRAFGTLAARHPSLRLRIDVVNDPLHAVIAAELTPGWWRTHAMLSDVPGDASEWDDSLRVTMNRRMELATDGVMRVDYWPAADGSSLLVWTIHHAVMDEASIDRSLVELHQLLSHEHLPPVHGTPAAFCAYERAVSDREAVREWADILITELQGLVPPLPRPPACGFEFSVPVDASLSKRFLAWCEHQTITPFAPLLFAYGQALQKVFGPHFRFVSTPFSRRAEAELLEPVGCLLDVRIVDAGVRVNERPVDALVRVNDVTQMLQRSSFLSRAALAEAISRRDPLVARHQDMFAFTWRLAPDRAVTLGASQARLVRVPQQGARFGMTLHAWMQEGTLRCSIEAVNAALEPGQAAAVGQVFLRRLGMLADIDEPINRLPSAPVNAASSETTAVLRDSWAAFTGVDAAAITLDSHFLRHGGNSLAAMRLAAQLRRTHGIVIDVGAFLAQPTFGALAGLAQRVESSPSVSLGRPDAPNVVLLFPGNLGMPVGMYAMGDALQQRLGDAYSVVIVDLEMLLIQAPHVDSAKFIFARINELVTQLGAGRIAATCGFSNGGLLALQVSDLLGETHSVPVWLLDTYAPMDSIHRLVYPVLHQLPRRILKRFAWPVVRRLLHYPMVARSLRTHVRSPVPPTQPPTPMARLRAVAHEELAARAHTGRVRVVHLIQARETVPKVGLLWRRASNGFRTGRFAEWHLHEVDGNHAQVNEIFAPTVAGIIADGVRQHVSARDGTKRT